MTPAQMFGVAVRAIGVSVALGSGWTLFYGFMTAWNLTGVAQTVVLEAACIAAVIQFLIGLSLILWPGWLVAFAYPLPWKPAELAADRPAAAER